jgi:hypothetical protein
MPLPKGQKASTSIRELHGGKTYARTKRKFGKKKAQKQAIAIALSNERLGKKNIRSTKRSSHRRLKR